jgi:hypothetical protein
METDACGNPWKNQKADFPTVSHKLEKLSAKRCEFFTVPTTSTIATRKKRKDHQVGLDIPGPSHGSHAERFSRGVGFWR